jgi:hypothetical protein
MVQVFAPRFFDIYQGEELPQYTININYVVDVNREDEDTWEVSLIGGVSYTLEGNDLQRFMKELSVLWKK